MSSPSPALDPVPLDPAKIAALPDTALGYTRRYLPAYLIGGLFLASFQFALNRIEWLTKTIVDSVFAPGAVRAVAVTSIAIMAGLGVFAFCMRLASRWFLFNAGRDAEYDLRSLLLYKLHRLGTSFYRRMSPGEIMSRATSDLAQVRLLFGFGVLNVLNVTFAITSALQVMLHISGRLTLMAFAVMPAIVLVTRTMSRQMFAFTRANQAELGELGDLAQRHFAGIRVVRSFAIERFAESKFGDSALRYLNTSLRLARIRSLLFPIMGAIDALGIVLVAMYGAYLLRIGPEHGGISAGGMFAFLMAWARMAGPMTGFGFVLTVMQRGRACFERLREVIIATPDVVEPTEPSTLAPTPTGLRVSRLRYQTDGRTILDDVSFELPAGRSLAIVGRTGSGKSTLAMLLVRLLPTPDGTVFLDERDLTKIDRATLRARVGYAQQDPFLFSSSVADNVAIGLDLAPGQAMSEQDLHEALRDAEVAEEIAALPSGSDTLVGERGVQLSGGQRQRVALARALVSHTPLLILDDPLSAVDARTEAAILDALRRRAELRSLMLITHRIAAAARCDRVLVLDGGKIVQSGTHAELAAQPGLYAELAEEQRVEGELAELAAAPEESVAEPVKAAPRAVAGRNADHDDALPIGTDFRLLKRLWPFLREERKALSVALVGLLVMAGLSLTRPAAMGALTAAAIAGTSLVGPALFMLFAQISVQAVFFVQNYLTQMAGARSMASMRLRLFRFTDRLSMRVFDRTPVGRLVTRVVNDVDAIGELFASGSVNALGDTATLVAVIGTMALLDWKLAIIAFAAVPAVALVVSRIRRGARTAYRDIRTTTALLNAMLNEQVTGVAVVQAFGREAAMAARLDVVSQRYRDANRRALLSEAALDAAVEMVQTLCMASVLMWTSYQIGSAAPVAFAVLIMFQQYLRQFFEPISMLVQRFTTVQMALASAERVFHFLDNPETEPEEDASAATLAPATTDGEQFSLSHVGFAYREGRPVLTDVSLSAARGERIALVGPTGAGKSTVTQLLLRLYDANDGEVRVLGRDVRKWQRQDLRRLFSVVPQEVVLFSGTLLENIAMGVDVPDRERAERALDHLGIRELMLSRVGGLDARVDERGLNFSVGERQLLAFARAVYHDAPILLLDEATANVDSHTEARIQRALEQLLKGRTALVIAHRLSTIESADRIVVFQAGRAIESGTHQELVAQGGLYARLHALQVRKARVAAAS